MTPQTFTAIINQLLPEPHASLLAGMLFGIKATMPRDFYQALVTTGTLHIIALSGTNITIIINILGSVFLIFGRRIATLLTIFWIVLFVLFVGPSASVIRASLMGAISLIGIYTGRQRSSLLILVVSAVFMLFLKPEWLVDVGFQLSFLATLGIIIVGSLDLSGFSPRLPKLPRLLKGFLQNTIIAGIVRVFWLDLRTTLAAQLFTLPVMLITFGQLSIISPLTNILVGWVVWPIMILGFVVSILGWLWLPLGQVASWLIYPFLEYFIVVVEGTSRLPFASITF